MKRHLSRGAQRFCKPIDFYSDSLVVISDDTSLFSGGDNESREDMQRR